MKYYVTFRIFEEGKSPEIRTKLVESTEKLKNHLDIFEYDPEDFELISIVPVKE